MLMSRTPRAGAITSSEAVISRKAYARLGNVPNHRTPSMLVETYGRVLTVAVFAKKDHKELKGTSESLNHHDSSTELQTYINRERFLLSELAAARGQVDKLLDQQQLLLNMVARLTGLGEPSGQVTGSLGGSIGPSAASQPQLPQFQAPPPPPRFPPPAAVPVSAGASSVVAVGQPSGGGGGSSRSSTSSDVPALTSLAELFKSAAAAAPHPASAAAAASIAAAVAAVDSGDILSITHFDIPQPQPPPPPPSRVSEPLGGLSAVPAATPSRTSESASGSEEELSVEVAKAAPTEPPPDLVLGDDDIFWLSKLHLELDQRGFFPGYDDMENWFFGETTLAAVLTFQASGLLPETGIVDRATWSALLGAEVADALYDRAASAEALKAHSSSPPSASSFVVSAAGRGSASSASSSASASSPPPKVLTKWPVLMEGDGGREVHALQVALANHGFHCGEDDMRWWQFGDATLMALKFYQSCSSVPESGVCDERSWRALLGADSAPTDLYSVRLEVVGSSDDEDGYEDDMEGVSNGRVWLLGEQRWERRAAPP